MTVWVHTVLLPLGSVAVQVTLLTPKGNWAGALLVTLTVPPGSLAVGEPSITREAKHWPTSTFVVTFGGQVSDGGVVSRTSTVKTR